MMFEDLTDFEISHYFNVAISTVRKWRTGQSLPPLYASLTVSAIKARLDPLDIHKFTPVTVARTLNVPISQVKEWKVAPLAACLALAAANPMPDKLREGDLKTLRKLYASKHYRSKYGWSSRKGSIRDETPDRLIAGGYVVIVPGKFAMPYLKVTSRGKRYLDKMAQCA